jgi:hypothetical protein
MKIHFITFLPALALLLCTSGCETGGTSTAYYGSYSGYYGYGDPWYYGDYDGDIIVRPPDGNRPSDRPHPSHPIAGSPSIPSGPRVSSGMGGMGGYGGGYGGGMGGGGMRGGGGGGGRGR